MDMPGITVPLLPDAMDSLPAAAYTCDRNGLITYYNPQAAALWGREPLLNSPEDRYCGSFRLFLPDGSPLPRDRCWMALTLLEDRAFLGHELIFERSDGSRVWALTNASPLHDECGALIGAIHVLVDITDRKRGERSQAAHQARLRAADRRKDEFLATLAHELRNPLAPLLQGLEVLRHRTPNPQTIDGVHDMMKRQLTQMARLIDDLLDIGRIGAGKIDVRREPVDLADVVHLAVETARCAIDEGGHALHVDLPDEPLRLNADLGRLAQVLTNLLSNAARYTAHAGRISLVAKRDAGDAVIRVRDTGVGIHPAMLADIFQLFTQAETAVGRSGGLGVGLHIARRLVHLHGGTLTAHSEGEGTGSEFVVRLPLSAAAPATSKLHARQDRRPARPLRPPVFDDNRGVAYLIATGDPLVMPS